MASIGQDPDPNVPSNGTSDIKIPNTKPEEELNALIAQATAKYAVKDYDAAAELYSRATELQAEINGEMSISNADLLYSYGRCLYHVAISKSDVLGSKVAGESARTTKKSARKRAADEIASDEHPEVLKVSKASNQVIPKAQSEAGPTSESKPYFQFTGDENFDDSEEEESADDDAEEEEDELSNAYEVLDLARVLLERKIKGLQGVAERTEVPPDLKGAKDRLADTHDLQAEISLEGERFSDATIDLRAALRLKQDIHPEDSSLIAEAHYKLSLALEFSSVTEQKNGAEEESAKEAYVDEAMREEAAQEMEAAISSCSLRIQREEATLKARETGDEAAKGNVSRASIDEVGEIVKDMQQRLFELRRPPVTMKDAAATMDGSNPLSGILGTMLGQSSEAQQTRLEEAAKGAKDVTSLIKKRKKPVGPPAGEDLPANGMGEKRKLEEDQQLIDAKKTRVEDASDG